MPTPFIMPKMDMDQETVTIIEWLKKEGDKVEKGEPVIVIETDKITSEVEAPANGKLARVLYKENEEAPVTKAVAYILADGESEADLPKVAEKSEPKDEKMVNKDEGTADKLTTQKAATPVAERLASALHININQIPSSGKKVTKADVETYIKSLDGVQPRVSVAATPAARRVAAEKGISLESLTGSGPRGRVQEVDVMEAASLQIQETRKPASIPGTSIPMVGMRKRIAERMTASYRAAPHIYLTVEVDMTEAENSRKRLSALADRQAKPKVSVTAYLVRMVAWALKRHPYLNASLIDDEIQLWDEVHIGIATALENGLIVPVIHNADTLSIDETNECLRNLTRQARNGELSKAQIEGGTFTISNLGMYGVKSFTAIINPPQSAILAVGSLVRKPVVIDENDAIAVRPILTMTLAADHRIVDGVTAAEFLSDLVEVLETPDLVLFEKTIQRTRQGNSKDANWTDEPEHE